MSAGNEHGVKTRIDLVLAAVDTEGPDVSNLVIAKIAGCDVKQVNRTISNMIDAGYLVRVYSGKKRKLYSPSRVPRYYARQIDEMSQPPRDCPKKPPGEKVERTCLRCKTGFVAKGRWLRLCSNCREFATNDQALA